MHLLEIPPMASNGESKDKLTPRRACEKFSQEHRRQVASTLERFFAQRWDAGVIVEHFFAQLGAAISGADVLSAEGRGRGEVEILDVRAEV